MGQDPLPDKTSVVGRVPFLAVVGLRAFVLPWLSARGHPRPLPHGPLQGVSCCVRWLHQSEQGSVSKTQATVFRKLISELTSHHTFLALLLEASHGVQLPTQWAWITQGVDTRRWGARGAALEAAARRWEVETAPRAAVLVTQ